MGRQNRQIIGRFEDQKHIDRLLHRIGQEGLVDMEEVWPLPIPLHRLRAGTDCTVYSLHVSPAMRQRLQDLGMVAGTKIRCLRNPKRCPMLLQIRGAWIALRQSDAQYILVNITVHT